MSFYRSTAEVLLSIQNLVKKHSGNSPANSANKEKEFFREDYEALLNGKSTIVIKKQKDNQATSSELSTESNLFGDQDGIIFFQVLVPSMRLVKGPRKLDMRLEFTRLVQCYCYGIPYTLKFLNTGEQSASQIVIIDPNDDEDFNFCKTLLSYTRLVQGLEKVEMNQAMLDLIKAYAYNVTKDQESGDDSDGM